MVISNKKGAVFLLVGDLLIFALSLWVSLSLRNGEFTMWAVYRDNLLPFLFVFMAWIIVFFIAGLYEKYTTVLKDKVSITIFNAQVTNTLIAIIFFYFIPYFGIAPKTILFFDLVVSFVEILG